jgi:hypothetical protein
MTGLGIYTQPIAPNRRLQALGYATLPASTSAVLDATAEETSATNITPLTWRWLSRRLEDQGRTLDPEEANSLYGIEGQLSWTEPVAEGIARELRDLKQAEINRQSVLARAQGGIWEGTQALGVGLWRSLLDPIGIAASFIPFVGQARYATALEGAGSAAGRALVRARLGAIEGAAGAAVLEPAILGMTAEERADYGLADSILNVAFGGVMGGGLHAGAGFAGDVALGRYRSPATEAVDSLTQSGRADVHEGLMSAAVGAVAEGRPVPPEIGAAVRAAMPPRRPVRRSSIQEVYDSEQRRIQTRYEVVEADSLVTSNLADGTINPAFPAELQPRQRDRMASREQISAMAADLQPARLGASADAATGAPVVSAEGVVESGNGRVLAIREAYARGLDADYRAFLAREGYQIEGMTAPVLVRRRVSELTPEDRRRFTVAAQSSGTLELSATERAMADAGAIDRALAYLDEAAELDAAANARFVRAYLEALPQSERGRLATAAGDLSADGLRRIKAGLLARAFGDADLVARITEAADPSSRSLGNALEAVAPAWARMRAEAASGQISAGADATTDLVRAVRMIRDQRAAGRPLAEVMDQYDAFDPPTPATSAFLAGMLVERPDGTVTTRSGEAITRHLRAYVDAAVKTSPVPDMFGAAPATADEILAGIRRVAQAGEIEDRAAIEAAERLAPADDPLPRRSEAGIEMPADDPTLDAELDEAVRVGALSADEVQAARAEIAALEAEADAEASGWAAAAFCMGRRSA